MVVECVRPDKACNITYAVVQQCWVANTNNTAVPGVVLCALAVAACIVLFVLRTCQKITLEFDVAIVLGLLTVMAGLCLVFWILVIVDNTTVQATLELPTRMQWGMFWLDKIILTIANLIYSFSSTNGRW